MIRSRSNLQKWGANMLGTLTTTVTFFIADSGCPAPLAIAHYRDPRLTFTDRIHAQGRQEHLLRRLQENSGRSRCQLRNRHDGRQLLIPVGTRTVVDHLSISWRNRRSAVSHADLSSTAPAILPFGSGSVRNRVAE